MSIGLQIEYPYERIEGEVVCPVMRREGRRFEREGSWAALALAAPIPLCTQQSYNSKHPTWTHLLEHWAPARSSASVNMEEG